MRHCASAASATAADQPLPEAQAPHPSPVWFTFDDYPRDAVVQRPEGTVRDRVVVGLVGRVRDCTILQSSGHEILDQQTCEILRWRAKFEQPRNPAGQALESQYVNIVEWRLPARTVRPPEPDRTVRVDMSNGKPSCLIDWDGIKRNLPPRVCRKFVAGMQPTASYPATFKVSATAQELGLR